MKLVETQTAVFNTISAKSNNQHSNTINQSSFSLPSNSFNENSHNTKQLALQEHQHPPIALPCSSQLHEISHPIQTPHQHCVKSVRIRCYSGPYFPAFGLNTERYGMWENADQNNFKYGHFLRNAKIRAKHCNEIYKCMGKLPENVNKQDICELFGLGCR